MEKSFIKKNMESNDPLVSSLYTELNERVVEFDGDGYVTDKMTMGQAKMPIVAVTLIIVFLISTIF